MWECAGPSSYDLLLSHDVNAYGHTQWFFFRVKHMVAGVKYKFNVINLEKKVSAFTKGMRPVMFSQRQAEECGVGWHRCMLAEDIFYFTNHRHKKPSREQKELLSQLHQPSLSGHSHSSVAARSAQVETQTRPAAPPEPEQPVPYSEEVLFLARFVLQPFD